MLFGTVVQGVREALIQVRLMQLNYFHFVEIFILKINEVGFQYTGIFYLIPKELYLAKNAWAFTTDIYERSTTNSGCGPCQSWELFIISALHPQLLGVSSGEFKKHRNTGKTSSHVLNSNHFVSLISDLVLKPNDLSRIFSLGFLLPIPSISRQSISRSVEFIWKIFHTYFWYFDGFSLISCCCKYIDKSFRNCDIRVTTKMLYYACKDQSSCSTWHCIVYVQDKIGGKAI